MHQLLCDHRDVFVLSEGEQGETDLIQLEIETGMHDPSDNTMQDAVLGKLLCKSN